MEQEERKYTNFGIEEIPNHIYYNAKYYGLIEDDLEDWYEVYLAQKENQEFYVIIGNYKNKYFMKDEIEKTDEMHPNLITKMLNLEEISLEERIALIKRKFNKNRILIRTKS